MKTYNHYILENNRSDTTPLTKSQFDDLLKTHCTQFSFNDKPIYRGIVGLESDYYKIDPTLYIRKSARSSNFFNVIVSNSPFWNHIPSREKSIICTINIKLARSYGEGHVYRIIPFDNSKWGLSHIWFKMYNDFNLMSFNDTISDIFNDIDDTNYEKIMLKLKTLDINTIDKFIQENRFSKYNNHNAMIFYTIKNIMVNKNITFDEAVLEFLKPNKNIDVMSYNDVIKTKINETSEIWTESACLLQKIENI